VVAECGGKRLGCGIAAAEAAQVDDVPRRGMLGIWAGLVLEELADRVGLLDRGELLFLEPVADVLRRYGVETLEEAFFAATGRTYEDERTEEDEEREVFA